MSIKRYDIYGINECCPHGPSASTGKEYRDDGEHVSYEDHAAEVEALRADAERYRALVASGAFSPGRFPSCPWGLRTGNAGIASKEDLDAAADAARTAKEQP